MLTTGALLGQERTVSGVVTSQVDNLPLPGVNVLVKGTSVGAVTDFNGKYKLSLDATDVVLVFSSIGFTTQEITVGNQTEINVSLSEDAEQLEEVVVTALGVERSAESLTYSTQQVTGSELTQVKDANMMNSLTGKVAGLQISKSGAGAGGSVKVNLRGNRSIAGNNSPLYVVDGIPMGGSGATQANSLEDPGRDGGDGISNLNPEDIESINVLRGAAASALYGSRAANGVILITTKKGVAGFSKVTFSSNFTAESILKAPEMQTKYAADGSAAASDPLTLDNFFGTGTNFVNSLSLTHGGEKSQHYFSYANTSATGILPTNTFSKHNFTFRQTASMFDDKLEVNGSVNYLSQKGHNRPTVGTPMNAIASAMLSPRAESQSNMENNYEVFSEARNLNVQNWGYNDTQYLTDNPYWVLNRNTVDEGRERYIVNGSAKYNFAEGIWAQARINLDNSTDVWEKKAYAGTNLTTVGENGGYYRDDYNNRQVYADALFNITKQFGDVSFTGLAGLSILDQRNDLKRVDTGRGTLLFANYFSPAGLDGQKVQYSEFNKQVQSVFGSAQFGYKDMLFLDLTARNDWSSTLQDGNNSYLYPSVGLSSVLNNMFELPEAISLAKVRAAYTVLGNDVAIGATNVRHRINPYTGVLERASIGPSEDGLKPEQSSSLEIGGELGLFNDRIYVDVNYYKTNTTNQMLLVDAPAGSSYDFVRVNAGNIENSGIEVMLTAMPVATSDFTWSTTVNFSKNKNEVIELFSDDKERIEWLTDGNNAAYSLGLKEGGSFGDIYGFDFKRTESGEIEVDENGNPQRGTERVKLGNSNPDFLLGWSNSLKYKNFNLNILIDARIGGEIMSFTQSFMDARKTSQAWADAIDKGTVTVEGKTFDAQGYYDVVSGRDGISSQYIYDATNIRLREVSFGYTFPNKLAIFEDVSLSVVGRNLFFFMNDAPSDPEVIPSAGNGMQGLDYFGIPATRSVGASLRMSF